MRMRLLVDRSAAFAYALHRFTADGQSKVTPSAKRRADQVNARKAANDERRAHITDISSKRSAIEQKKVGHFAFRCGRWSDDSLPIR
jgi:hypothetical protein